MRVLAEAKNLDAYVAELDKEKLQSAVVRKAIGQAYVQQGRPRQGRPAVATRRPNCNPTTRRRTQVLIGLYDKRRRQGRGRPRNCCTRSSCRAATSSSSSNSAGDSPN